MDKNLVLEKVIETVACFQGTTSEDIGNSKWHSARHGLSQRCPTKIAVAKQIVCYLAIKYLLSYKLIIMREIGEAIGHKTHVHVKNYYRVTANRMEVDTEFCQKVIEIEAEFLKNVLCTYSKFSVPKR